MPARPESPRTRRVADRIAAELAEILSREVEDPRLRALNVTAARVTRDLTAARVWVSGRLRADEEGSVRAALEHATPYFRTLLAPRLGLRVVPSIRFEFDRTLEAGARIEELLREIKRPEPVPAPDPTAAPGAAPEPDEPAGRDEPDGG